MHFAGHGSLSVELFEVKKIPKTRKILKISESDRDLGKLEKVSHGRSWNLESSKEYLP